MKKIFIIFLLFKFLDGMPSMSDIPQPTDQMGMQGQPSDGSQMMQNQPAQQQGGFGSQQPSTEPPATYDQMKWPDSIELNEKQGDVVKSDDPKVIELSKKASQIADQLKNVADKIKELTDKINREMARMNSVLDDFYQRLGFEEGMTKAMLK